nr:hypothetical protein [Tanacetum cinerariifolium]
MILEKVNNNVGELVALGLVDEDLCSQCVETASENHVTPSGHQGDDVRIICDGVRIEITPDLATRATEIPLRTPDGNDVVPLQSDTIWLVQKGCSFHGLRFEDP